MALNERQLRFVEEYLVDLNATQAYIRAGYSPRGARTSANNLLANTDIQNMIAKAKAKRSGVVEWTAAEILADLKEIATDRSVRPRDRLRAYELGGKHLGLYREVIEHIGQQIDFSALTTDDLRLLIGGKPEQRDQVRH